MESPQVITIPANVLLLINADSAIMPLVEMTVWTSQFTVDLNTDHWSLRSLHPTNKG
jgi:hypothetical protein